MKINNIEINRVSQFIFLWIMLSADLKWKKTYRSYIYENI